jgi:hypothetical protein
MRWWPEPARIRQVETRFRIIWVVDAGRVGACDERHSTRSGSARVVCMVKTQAARAATRHLRRSHLAKIPALVGHVTRAT